MKLKKVRVTEFQSIRDSTEFEVGDITCLVGKNESGKTALLQAIYRVNPFVASAPAYSVVDDYPRWDVEDYRQAVESGQRTNAVVATLTFELEPSDLKPVVEQFGPDVLRSKEMTVTKGYEQSDVMVSLQVDEARVRDHLVSQHKVPDPLATKLRSCESVSAMQKPLAAETTPPEGTKPANLQKLTELVSNVTNEGELGRYIFNKILWSRTPKFLYFADYYQMKGHANIGTLKQRKEANKLEPSDYPLLGLINRARLNLDELLNPTRTRDLKNRIEGAGNHLTKKVIEYWSQNRYLELRFDVRPGMPGDPEGMRDGTNIWGDVYDSKHKVTTEIGTRSRGFVWFFSFLAWYSDIVREKQPVILLLDEPGLSLHGKAQGDLLRYFDAEVKGNHQLIYTTHSPFMVEPTNFDRVRIVQDLSIESDKTLPLEQQGTKVLTDVLEATADSLFPLQAALGYEIYQTLFIGPNSLVVEGSSDLLYLQAMSAVLSSGQRTGLSQDWTITVVGGSDKVPTFVALLGAQGQLNVAVLIDFQKKDRQAVENLWKHKLLKKKNVLTFADFVKVSEADIEDMFEVSFYLNLVNAEFSDALTNAVKEDDLTSSHPRILVRLEEYFKANPLKGGVAFNHFRPARYLVENIGALQGEIAEATLDRFEAAFKAANALL